MNVSLDPAKFQSMKEPGMERDKASAPRVRGKTHETTGLQRYINNHSKLQEKFHTVGGGFLHCREGHEVAAGVVVVVLGIVHAGLELPIAGQVPAHHRPIHAYLLVRHHVVFYILRDASEGEVVVVCVSASVLTTLHGLSSFSSSFFPGAMNRGNIGGSCRNRTYRGTFSLCMLNRTTQRPSTSTRLNS